MSDPNEPVFDAADDHEEGLGSDPAETESDGIDIQRNLPAAGPAEASRPLRVARPENPSEYVPQSARRQNPAADEPPDDPHALLHRVEAEYDEGHAGAAGEEALDGDADGEAELPYVEPIELGPTHLLLFGITLGLALLVGLFMYYPMAIPCGVLALVLGTGMCRLVANWRVSKWKTSTVLAVVGIAVHAFLVFAVYPAWAAHRAKFGQALIRLGQQLDNAAEKAREEFSGDEKTTAAEKAADDVPAPAAAAAEEDIGAATRVTTGADRLIRDFTTLAIWKRLVIFIQLSLLTTVFIFLPVFVQAAAPGLGTATEQPTFRLQCGAFALKCIHRCGRFSVVRIFKAVLMAVLTAIGLAASGIDGWWFIAVIVGLVATICNLGPVVAVVLAAILVPVSPSVARAVVGLVLLLVVLILAERKLDWYLRLVPLSKRYNLPPEMLTRKGSSGVRVLAFLPSIMSGLVILLICFTLFLVFDVHRSSTQREELLRRGRRYVRDFREDEAEDAFAEVLEQHPEDREALLGLIDLRIREEKFDEAMQLAKRIADWQPPSATAPMARMRAYIAETIEADSGRDIRAAEGYERILEATSGLADQDRLHRDLADRLRAVDKDSMYIDHAEALAAFHQDDYEGAIAAVSRGFDKAQKRGRDEHSSVIPLLLLKAEALFGMKDYLECAQTCGAILAIDGDHKRARELRRHANQQREMP